MKLVSLLFVAAALLTTDGLLAQDKTGFKFNKISKEEFVSKIYGADSNSKAITPSEYSLSFLTSLSERQNDRLSLRIIKKSFDEGFINLFNV